jgi:large subunit ribosomal protein L24
MVRIRKGDKVQIIAGKDKGVIGTVIQVIVDQNRIIVEGVNRIKKHTKVGEGIRGAQSGGIITTEAPIHISNAMVLDDTGKPTRTGIRREKAEKTRANGSTHETTRPVRVSKRTGKDI